VVVTLVILVAGYAIFGFTPALFVTLYVGMAAAYVAIPYTVVALVAREVNAWRGRHDGAARRDGDGGGDGGPELSDDAIRFGLTRQRASIATAIAMLVALIVFVAALVGGWGDRPGTTLDLISDRGLLTFGPFAAVSGVLAIVVNVPSIYSRLVVGSERYAIRHRVGAWKLILANTILTTASWIAYCGFAVHFLIRSS